MTDKERFSYYYILHNPRGYVEVLEAIEDGTVDRLRREHMILTDDFGRYETTDNGIEKASGRYWFEFYYGE